MSERAEAFMDNWLDKNVGAKQSNRPEKVVAKILAKRCLADVKKRGIPLEEIVETVGDIEEAITDELRAVAAATAEKPL